MSKVLVTGASRGLGRALMESLAKRGAEVVGVARDADRLRRAVEAVDGRAHAVAADVGTDAQRIVQTAQALVGPLDLVILAASTLGPVPLRPLGDTTEQELRRVLEVNLLGSFAIASRVLGEMVLRGEGTVVFVSSDAAVEAYPTWGAYSVSKAAQDHLARVWAAELAGTGVRVLSVDPGEMDTAMHAAALPDADPATLAQPSEAAERILAWLADAPSGQRGTP